jgi:hypothetical protein
LECEYSVITPCCGNSECEAGETHQDCPEDCEQEEQDDQEQESGTVIISQAYYNGLEPGQERDEYIVLYNPSSGLSADLSGWSIGDNSKSWMLPNITLDSKEYLVITRNSSIFEQYHGCEPDISSMTLRLNNGGDQLMLYDGDSLVDFMAWEGGYDDMYEDWDLKAGEEESLKRILLAEQTPAAWDVGEPEPCV